LERKKRKEEVVLVASKLINPVSPIPPNLLLNIQSLPGPNLKLQILLQ